MERYFIMMSSEMLISLYHYHDTALTGEQLRTKDNTKYLNVSSLACCYLNHSAPITRSQLKYIKAVKGFVMFLLAEKCYISCHIVIEVAIIVIGHRSYVM